MQAIVSYFVSHQKVSMTLQYVTIYGDFVKAYQDKDIFVVEARSLESLYANEVFIIPRRLLYSCRITKTFSDYSPP